MDSIFGLCGSDWVVVAADTAVNRSIFTLKHDDDKILSLNTNKVLAAAGEQTDRYQFCNYIQKNLELQAFRTGHELSVEASAQYYIVNCLIGGFDHIDGKAKLFWMDYFGTLQQVTKGAHGYAAYFVNSVLDNNYHKDMTLEDGIATLKKCIQELRTRFIINQPAFIAKIVTKEGIRIINLDQ